MPNVISFKCSVHFIISNLFQRNSRAFYRKWNKKYFNAILLYFQTILNHHSSIKNSIYIQNIQHSSWKPLEQSYSYSSRLFISNRFVLILGRPGVSTLKSSRTTGIIFQVDCFSSHDVNYRFARIPLVRCIRYTRVAAMQDSVGET